MTAAAVPAYAKLTSQVSSNACFTVGSDIWTVGGSGSAQSVTFPGRSGWTTYDTDSSINFRAGVGSNSVIVLVGAGDDAVYSDDGGTTWNTSSLPSGRSWSDIIRIGGETDVYIAIDSTAFGANCAAYSVNTVGDPPTSWTQSPLSNTVGWATLVEGPFGVFALGEQSYSYSSDLGVSWSSPASLTGVGSSQIKKAFGLGSGGIFVLLDAHYALAFEVIVDFDVDDYASLPLGAFDGQLYRTTDNNQGWVSDGNDGWTGIGVILDDGNNHQMVWRTFSGPITAGGQTSLIGNTGNEFLVSSPANDTIAYLLNFQGAATNQTTLDFLTFDVNDFAYNLSTDTFWQYDGTQWNDVGTTISNIWGIGSLQFPFTSITSILVSDNEWDLGHFIFGQNSADYYRSQGLLIDGRSPVLPWTL